MAENSPSMRGKKLRSLTPEAFARLLNCLAAEQDQAAAMYEEIRRALITFFAFRNATDPHALTDETLNRVAYRLSEGQAITTENPKSYFYAVARNVWRETLAQPHTTIPFSEQVMATAEMVPSVEDLRTEVEQRLALEQRLDCLEHCLATLADDDHAILLTYHQGQGRTKIESRQALAERFGITIGSMRNRACRLRDRMADCIESCVGNKE